MIDGADWYLATVVENERQRALLAVEQQFQISIASAKATYVPGVNDATYAAAVTSASVAKTSAIVAAHAAVSAANAARAKLVRGNSR